MADYKNILETLIEESHDIIALAKSGTKTSDTVFY